MRVREVMMQPVELIDPETMIQHAAQKMRDEDIGALPVGENDRLVGMVTDRDITVRAVAEGKRPENTPVREVLSRGVAYCFEDDTLEKACEAMAKHQIRRLPVLNRDKRLVGFVSMADLARHGGEGRDAAEAALREISVPTGASRH